MPQSVHTPALAARRWHALLAPLQELARADRQIEQDVIGQVDDATGRWPLLRFVFRGPSAEVLPLRLGLFAVVHGDEPAGALAIFQLLRQLASCPEAARGMDLFCYPVCNPAGLTAGTRHNGAGVDLNREFWRGSSQPEVRVLEHELMAQAFDGIVALHADNDSAGLYAFARGAVIVQELVEPALRAAETVCRRNRDVAIDGFEASNGVIREWYPGVLAPPQSQTPAPFEIVLETPGLLPLGEQAEAARKAVRGLLSALPRLQSVAAGI